MTTVDPYEYEDDDEPPARYFVCDDCAHTWSAPEMPDACEYCRRGVASISEYDDIEDAEVYSEDVLAAHALTRTPHA